MEPLPVKIKPPLGAIPKWVHDESRMVHLKEAIERFIERNIPVNIEWIEEYNILSKQFQERILKTNNENRGDNPKEH